MQLLGGLSGKQFLSQFWQKKPLLIRNAISDFKGVVQASELFALAARPDIESRIVRRDRGTWKVHEGPISRSALGRLPSADWTMLVQGLNLEVPAADALLRRFAFVPHARLARGGGAGASPGGTTRRSTPGRRSRSCGASAPNAAGCSGRETCSTCRRDGRTTVSHSIRA
jgi:50S ribosomal protein L16 3-hydroxylase